MRCIKDDDVNFKLTNSFDDKDFTISSNNIPFS